MVLEAIISPLTAEKRPWHMLFIGALYSSVAIIISLLLFRPYASLVAIFLTVFASVPVMYSAIKMEEKRDLQIQEPMTLFQRHGKVISFFTLLFFGYMFSFITWYLVLPSSLSGELFEVQQKTIHDINSPITGNAAHIKSPLAVIFFNNVKVLVFCLLFAFFYGFGAIFILTWNASVIAAAIAKYAQTGTSLLGALPIAFLRYSIHGYMEIVAYFMGGLAGGIISVAIIRHDVAAVKFKRILADSSNLIVTALALLMVAAVVEVYLNPFSL